MNVIKIMTDLLKAVGKDKTATCNYGVDEEYIYFLPDGYRGYRIPKLLFLIDLEKALPNKTPLNNPSKFFDDKLAELAVKTNEIRVIGKDNVVKIKGETSHAWLNVNYLKEFGPDCTFKVVSPKSPVYVYEWEKLVGIVLPVRVAEEG